MEGSSSLLNVPTRFKAESKATPGFVARKDLPAVGGTFQQRASHRECMVVERPCPPRRTFVHSKLRHLRASPTLPRGDRNRFALINGSLQPAERGEVLDGLGLVHQCLAVDVALLPPHKETSGRPLSLRVPLTFRAPFRAVSTTASVSRDACLQRPRCRPTERSNSSRLEQRSGVL